MRLNDYFSDMPPTLNCGQKGYDMNETREAYMLRVELEGKAVVLPADNQLQIDIDSDEHYAAFLLSAEVVLRNWEGACEIEVEEHPSSSGLPCRHITLTLPFNVDPWQRIALQAALGSDPVRELLSATRLLRGDIHPTLFVEPPTQSLNRITTMENNLALLRPFDIDKVRAGEPVCLFGKPDTLIKVIGGPDAINIIAYTNKNLIHTTTIKALRMAPLCWLEGRPVYSGDVLWRNPVSRIKLPHKVEVLGLQGSFLYFAENNGTQYADNRDGELSWSAPKPKTETVKFLAYLRGAGNLVFRDERVKAMSDWRRVPGADRTEEVEL